MLDPEELIINQEEFIGLEDKMAEILSDLERKVTDALSGWTLLSGDCRGFEAACEVH